MAVYKVLAEEVDNVELNYPTEVLLSATNTQSTATTLNTATNAQTALENLEKIQQGSEVFETTQKNVTTTTFGEIDTALTVTPGAGTWTVEYTGDTNMTGVNATGEVQLYIDGVAVPRTLRGNSANTAILGLITLSSSGGRCSLHFKARLTLTASNVLTVRYRINPATAGQGTMQVLARSLLLERVGLT